MRVDPDAVYLELSEGQLVWNMDTNESRVVPAVQLHFKEGGKWQRRSFVGREDEVDTLGSILERIGKWIDRHGIDGALEQAATPRGGA